MTDNILKLNYRQLHKIDVIIDDWSMQWHHGINCKESSRHLQEASKTLKQQIKFILGTQIETDTS
jgi:hypothetical protein